MFKVAFDKSSKEALTMIQETWQKRLVAFQHQLNYQSAKYVQDTIKDILKGDEYKDYRDALRLSRLTGLNKKESGYVVFIADASESTKVKDVPANRTLILIRAKKAPKEPRKDVMLLQQFSPWTLSNIPFMPNKNDAEIIYKKTSASEVRRVEKNAKRNILATKKAFQKQGVKYPDTKKGIAKTLSNAKSVPDVAMQGLQMETAFEGNKSRPHWKPAISRFKNAWIPSALKNKELLRAMYDPYNRQYMSWPTKVSLQTPISAMSKYKDFMAQIGLK